ncbi:MAG: hypothetical protein O3B37_06850 [Proteobacteria bacterium]|nr:hypothetical protein [Pseudomonadota bacterium]
MNHRHQRVFGSATIAAAAFVFATVGLRAEPVSVDQIRLTTEIYDAVVNYPPPSWVVGEVERASIPNLSVYNKAQQESRFAIERLPIGETNANWTRLYVASGIYAGKGSNVPLAAFVDFGLNPMKGACGQSKFIAKRLEQNADAVTILLFCESYAGVPPGRTGASLEGEIALLVFAKYRDTLYMIHHHWRGAPFEAANEASWPVERAVLDLMIDRFASIRIAEMAPFGGR